MTSPSRGVDRVRRSYAILGLKPGASLPEIRRRYRFLARRWHPDRYVSDVRNQAEAEAEMQRINDAYRVLVTTQSTSAGAAVRPSGGAERLSPEEIEALANAIRSEGPVDRILNAAGWVGSTLEGVVAILFGAGLAMRVALGFHRGDFREHPEVLVLFALLGALVFRELWLRARVTRRSSRQPDSEGARTGRRTSA